MSLIGRIDPCPTGVLQSFDAIMEKTMKPKWIITLILVFLMMVLFLQNNQVVTYRFLFWEVGISQLVLLPLTTLIGFIIGLIVGKLTGSR
jgi:uncharacterized integral membrane protein